MRGGRLTGLTWTDGEAADVTLEDCDLTAADVSGCRFDGVELRGCRIEGLRGVEALRGVAMPWGDVLQHAAVFAGACGVRVLDA